jgi:hypothetical protein
MVMDRRSSEPCKRSTVSATVYELMVVITLFLSPVHMSR